MKTSTDTSVPMPIEVDSANMVFPTTVEGFLPPRNELPEEFQKNWNRNDWCKVASEWFFKGIDTSKWMPQKGIVKEKALRHIGYCLGSWEPSHEHKIGGVGYLLSLWFKPKGIIK